MPTLKSLTCHLRWAETNAPFQEYGTWYGDGVVETFIVVPNQPQTFTILLTSKDYIFEGLSMIVFIDGNYQCNRNRVNLLPPKRGLPRERTEVSFLVRQKEKSMGEGTYMGREWRFDDHNIVAELPQGAKESHFDLLGTIEVLVLRCKAKDPDETNASTSSSAAESDIFSPYNEFAAERQEEEDRSSLDCQAETTTATDEPLSTLVGVVDGSTDYATTSGLDGYGQPPGNWEWNWRPQQPNNHETGYQGQQQPCPPLEGWSGYSDAGHHDFDDRRYSDIPYRGPPSAGEHLGNRSEKRVHFDYGPSGKSPYPRVGRYTDRPEDQQGSHGPSLWPSEKMYRSAPGLSVWEERYRSPYGNRRRHEEYQPQHSRHYMYNADNGRYNEYPPPPTFLPPGPPPPPPHPGIRPNLHHPGVIPSWVGPPPRYFPPPLASGMVPTYPTLFSGPRPTYFVGQPSTVGFGSGPNTNGVGDGSQQGDINRRPDPLDSSNDEKNNIQVNGGWTAQNSGNDGQKGGDNGWGNANDNSNNQVGDAGWSSGNNNGGNQDTAWVNDAGGNQQTNNEWSHHTGNNDNNWGKDGNSNQNTSNDVDQGFNNSYPTPAGGSGVRPLYGPYGAYYALKTSAPEAIVPGAEEEPRYDVPQSVVNAKSCSKQVQPGKGFLYTKKRCCPEYLDTLDEPYARFVFKYRTKDQLKHEIGVELETEPSADEEVQTLQNMDKSELIDMLLRAQGALGGRIPEGLPKVVSPAAQTSLEPVPVDPPAMEFLRYQMPPLRNTPNAAGGAGGGSNNDGWSNAGGNNNQNSTGNWNNDSIGGGWGTQQKKHSNDTNTAWNNNTQGASGWDGSQEKDAKGPNGNEWNQSESARTQNSSSKAKAGNVRQQQRISNQYANMTPISTPPGPVYSSTDRRYPGPNHFSEPVSGYNNHGSMPPNTNSQPLTAGQSAFASAEARGIPPRPPTPPFEGAYVPMSPATEPDFPLGPDEWGARNENGNGIRQGWNGGGSAAAPKSRW